MNFVNESCMLAEFKSERRQFHKVVQPSRMAASRSVCQGLWGISVCQPHLSSFGPFHSLELTHNSKLRRSRQYSVCIDIPSPTRSCSHPKENLTYSSTFPSRVLSINAIVVRIIVFCVIFCVVVVSILNIPVVKLLSMTN